MAAERRGPLSPSSIFSETPHFRNGCPAIAGQITGTGIPVGYGQAAKLSCTPHFKNGHAARWVGPCSVESDRAAKSFMHSAPRPPKLHQRRRVQRAARSTAGVITSAFPLDTPVYRRSGSQLSNDLTGKKRRPYRGNTPANPSTRETTAKLRCVSTFFLYLPVKVHFCPQTLGYLCCCNQ